MFGSNRFLLSLTVVFVCTTAFISWQLQSGIEDKTRTEMAESLNTVLGATHQAVRSWTKEHQAATKVWANTAEIRAATKSLLAQSHDQQTLLESAAQAKTRAWLRPVLTGKGYQGYFIIGPDQINLASSRDQNIGHKNLLITQQAFFQKIWSGETAISLPEKSDVPLPDKNGKLRDSLPTMFVGAPINDESGKVLAVFTFRINPADDFASILQQGRIGNTGESYAFNKQGLMISNSRFNDQLRNIGLIDKTKEAILNIKITDPTVNLLQGEENILPENQRSLTLMASNAVAGQSGINLDGYRDYRGVSVISAWRWDDQLGFGIATELDADEAFKTIHTTRYTIITLTLLLILLSFGMMVIYFNNRARKHAQQALGESEARLTNFFQATFEGIFLHEDGKILDVNPATTAVFGYDPNENIGRNLLEFVVPESREMILAHMAAGHEGPYEVGIVAKDGSTIPVEVLAKSIELHGKQIRVAGLRDITERKQAEAALRESDQYNRMLFEESTIGLALCRMNGDLVDVNPTYASILGRSVEETIKLRYWDITPDKYAAQEQAQLENLEKTGRYGPYEKEYIHADGHLVPVRLSGQILKKGGEKFIWSSVEDITKYKQAEKALQRSEVLERLATGASLNEILIALVSNAEKHNPEILCTVMLLDEGDKHLRTCAAPNLPDFFTDALDGMEIGHAVAACGEAAFTGKRVIVEDIMEHPNWVAYRKLARKANLRACWSEPVISSTGDILGTFAIYNREPCAPSQSDLDFIQDSARLAAIAIEHNQAEEALTLSEERYRTVVQQQTEMICRFKPDFTLTFANQAYYQYFGKSESDLLCLNFFDLIPEEAWESARQHFDSFTQDQSVQIQEHPVIAPDGSQRWQQWANQAFFDDNGKLAEFQAVGRDITERKRAEEELRESEVTISAIFETAAVGVAMIESRSGTFLRINQRYSDIIGYKHEEMQSLNFMEITHPDDLQEDLDNMQLLLKGKIHEFSMEKRLLRKDGSLVWVNLAVSPMRKSGEQPEYHIAVIEDITERKQAEEKTLELLQQNRDLTQRLFQIQEQERRHLARELHDEFGQWITVINLHAQIMKGKCSHCEMDIRESIKIIKDISTQMNQGIRQMIHQLRPVVLDELGLKDSLQELVDQWQEHYPQTDCALGMEGSLDDFNDSVNVTIYRIVQESLTNVAKYAERTMY